MTALAECISSEHLSLVGLRMPMTIVLERPLSDEALMAFSANNRPYRIEQNAKGEITIMTPVGGRGSLLESYVIRKVDVWAEEHGGFSFSSQGGFRLPDGAILSPDACWISAQRWEALTDEQQITYPPLCPDFLVEVLSQNDSKRVLESKMEIWMANGARLAWLLDPKSTSVTIYSTGKEPRLLQQPTKLEAEEVVPGLILELDRFWPKPR